MTNHQPQGGPRPHNPHIRKYDGLTRVYKAFLNSRDGFISAYRSEAAFRQEVWLACVLIPLAIWLNVSMVERVLLIGSVLFVMIVELLNSAVEAVVDRISLERHELSKHAKDVGSTAVLLAFALLFLTWGSILLGR